jgi:hypothetical protein
MLSFFLSIVYHIQYNDNVNTPGLDIQKRLPSLSFLFGDRKAPHSSSATAILCPANFSFALTSNALTNSPPTCGANFLAKELYTGFAKSYSTPKLTVVPLSPGTNLHVAFNWRNSACADASA